MRYPESSATVNLATGVAIDNDTGKVYESYRRWQQEKQSELAEIHRRTCAEERDLVNDMQNLPGTKPYFYDDFFGIVAEQRRPDSSRPPEL